MRQKTKGDRSKVDASRLAVMKKHCKTCPFKPNEKGHFQNPKLANEVIERTLFKAQQICHGTEGKNREPHNRCFGSFEYNSEIYERFGLDKEKFRDGIVAIK